MQANRAVLAVSETAADLEYSSAARLSRKVKPHCPGRNKSQPRSFGGLRDKVVSSGSKKKAPLDRAGRETQNCAVSPGDATNVYFCKSSHSRDGGESDVQFFSLADRIRRRVFSPSQVRLPRGVE